MTILRQNLLPLLPLLYLPHVLHQDSGSGMSQRRVNAYASCAVKVRAMLRSESSHFGTWDAWLDDGYAMFSSRARLGSQTASGASLMSGVWLWRYAHLVKVKHYTGNQSLMTIPIFCVFARCCSVFSGLHVSVPMASQAGKAGEGVRKSLIRRCLWFL